MRVVVLALAVLMLASAAHAQRRHDTASPSPIEAQLAPEAGHAHRYTLRVTALRDVALTEDVRLVHLEVRAPGSRRALTCDSPTRSRRLDPSLVHSLHVGETWSATIDVRMFCWGRALAALDAGAELSGTFGTARGRRGVPVARTDDGEFLSAALPTNTVAAIVPASATTGDVIVSAAASDAASGARVSLRVSIRSSRAVRAWVRPDHVAFRVVAPDGTTHRCAMPRSEAAAIPDLFAHLSSTRGPALSLDARAYCGAAVFAHAGIYELTPMLTLDADGRAWRMDTPLGTFEGAAALVRVRADSGSAAR